MLRLVPPGRSATGDPLAAGYDLGGFYDEMFSAAGVPRPHCERLAAYLANATPEQLEEQQQIVERAFLVQGITFAVYKEGTAPSGCSPST